MNDKWEGLLTEKTAETLFRYFYSEHHDANMARAQIQEYERHREDFHINCWHMNDVESYLMWKVYADRGCAIQTTFERIQIAFDQFKGEVNGGVVEYVDFRREEIPIGNVFHPIVKKDLPYRDEKEFRLVFWQTSLANQGIPVGANGVNVRVELNKLIANIWLSPQLKEPASEIERLAEAKDLDCGILSSAVREISIHQVSQSGA